MPNVTGHHFHDVFIAPSYFLITNTRVATEEFFYVMHSCCCLTGLGLGLGVIHLVLVFLVLIFYSLGLGLGLNMLVLFLSLACIWDVLHGSS